MTLLYRVAFLALLTGFLTACETIHMDKPMSPVVIQTPTYPQPAATPVPPAAYPSQPQPAQVPAAPIQTPPLPPSVPPKAAAPKAASAHAPGSPVVPAAQTIKDDNMPSGAVVPVRTPGSVSQLPDPS